MHRKTHRLSLDMKSVKKALLWFDMRIKKEQIMVIETSLLANCKVWLSVYHITLNHGQGGFGTTSEMTNQLELHSASIICCTIDDWELLEMT